MHGIAQMKYYGKVFDNETKKPIPNISVTAILKKDTIKTKTDSNGQYIFYNVQCSVLHIQIRSRNYRPFDISAKIANQKGKYSHQIGKIHMTQSYYNTMHNRAFALGNIANSNMFILLPGGIAGSKIFDSDTTFEYKYKVKYRSQGCMRDYDDNEEEYNLTIFEFLDKTYGTAWRKEIRPDAIGLK